MARFQWFGADRLKDMERATRQALEEVAGDAVDEAKRRVRVRTGTLQGSLMFQPVFARGRQLVIQWGSFDVNYALWQEIGTSQMSAQPYLRPGADKAYPKLGKRIRSLL